MTRNLTTLADSVPSGLVSGRQSLRDLTLAIAPAARWLSDEQGRLRLSELDDASCLASTDHAGDFSGLTVLIATKTQLAAVLATLDLDGLARRILLCPPDLDPVHLPAIIDDAGVDVIVTDGTFPLPAGAPCRVITCHRKPSHKAPVSGGGIATEWVLFTSGTTGRPKMVVHTLASLSGPLDDGARLPSNAVWSTFYDVRRYGGLQILLRALIGGGSMVLSGAHEPVGDFIDRAATDGVTHISGTPSHWRRALMSPLLALFKPNYVRLSGEPADQAILDQLKRAFPAARLSHAFASTEAGVAFDVRDGRAGIPAAYIDDNGTPQEGVQAELILRDGVLCIRSSRTAQQYLGAVATPLADADGFVATNDMLERREDRYFFIGRQEGVINVGGQKVYPEEVEAVINQHPDVRMSRVRARVSPITGAIVTADIVLHPGVALDHARANPIRDEIAQRCRDHLAAHKVPVSLKIVPSLDISAAGKLLRGRA